MQILGLIIHIRIYSYFRRLSTIIRNRKGNKIGKSTVIHPQARIGTGCIIGKRVVVSENVEIASKVTIGSGAILENISIGMGSVIEGSLVITGYGNGKISIGQDSYIGHDTALDFSDDISIGSFVHIAGLSTGLWTHSSALMCLNSISLTNKAKNNRPTKPIIIEDNVYIGGNCTIYPGITIGHHSIVAPNSAVTKDIPPYSMVGGVPARFIKSTKDMVYQLKKIDSSSDVK